MAINERGKLPLSELSSDRCPHCSTNLVGGEVPGRPGVHARREIWVETDDHDGALYHVCPDCDLAWPRFIGGGSLTDLAKQHVLEHNQRIVETRRRETAITAALASDQDAIESACVAVGLNKPTAWRYGPWSPSISVLATFGGNLQWDSLKTASADLTAKFGYQLHLQPLAIGGWRAFYALQMLRNTQPWRGASLEWVQPLWDAASDGTVEVADVEEATRAHLSSPSLR